MDSLELARRLIGHHSVSNVSSRPVADFVSNFLDEAGFVVEQHTYNLKGVEKVNVIARKGGDGQPELALAGHCDREYIHQRAVRQYWMETVGKRYDYALRTILNVHRSDVIPNGWYAEKSFYETRSVV